MVTYSASAVRGIVDTLVNAVFNEPVPLGTICPQEWRRGRLLDVIGEAFADQHGPVDGSMPWHKWMPATASAAAPSPDSLAARSLRVALSGVVSDDDPHIIADMMGRIEELEEQVAALSPGAQ